MYLTAARVARDRSYHGTQDELDGMARLQEALEARGRRNDTMSVAWLRSVLLERRNTLPEARTIVERIRDDLEYQRTGTRDLGLKASVTGAFSRLAARLTALRYATGASAAEIFDAIEWGKGRALADSADVHLPDLATFTEAVGDRRLHYLTFIVDQDAVYGMLVVAHGRPVVQHIQLPRAEGALKIAVIKMRRFSREGWADGVRTLLGWLPAPTDDGPIRLGDTVLIAPHGDLHLVPLHALPVSDGGSLAPRTAVVRVHSAAMVLKALEAPAPVPHKHLAARVPHTSDPPNHGAIVAEVHAALKPTPGTVLEEGEADADAIWSQISPGTLVHFTTHGDIRTSTGTENPYEDAGIALAYRRQVPTIVNALDDDHLFTSRRLQQYLDSDPPGLNRLAGTHITLQACVSGYARANPQGDAVGLEWSFLLGGAASVISTHWHVELPAASRLCAAFYREWLRKPDIGRAEAWRRAIAAERNTDPGDDNWRAFTLTGMWQ
jgi:hypothetical protein